MNGALPRPTARGNAVNPEPSAPTFALAPEVLAAHTDLLYRAARGLCRSHHEAEDLVQEMFAQVLTRPRLLRRGHEVGYLLRALRNTHVNRRRAAARRPLTVPLPDTDFGGACVIPATVTAREVLSAIAGAPEPYRQTVLAIDVLGLSYEQAALHLQTNTATITSRLARGRRCVARSLGD
jgi:RNA polymerase sigma-70 factor, ECF subfamily